MKSYITLFSELYRSLARDFTSQYPSIEREIERDLGRLQSSFKTEGLGFVTLTHPAMNDFFQKSLAIGAFADSPTMTRPRGLGRKSVDDHRPRYLWCLFSMIFEEDGTLKPDPDVNAIAFVRQWLLMAKKVEIDCSEERKEASLTDFLAVDASLPDHHRDTWDLDDPVWCRREGHPLWGCRSDNPHPDLFDQGADDGVEPEFWVTYRAVCDRFRSMIGSFDPWSARPKHGPGAVADPGPGLKYDFKHWPRKLQQYFPWDYFASSDFGLSQIELDRAPLEREYPSVVLCVPKSQKGPRIICKEPVAHMWMQGAIERFLVRAISDNFLSTSINLRDQSLSQRFALEASEEGTFATVDLSAASDRISTRLVEYVFGGGDNSLLDALHACRSRHFVLNGEMYKFRKFAPAGSACTFPVQSIVFLTICVAVLLHARGLPLSDWTRVLHQIRVFGDDIIVPTDSIPVLYRVMASLRLKVNESKSYHTGLFRESCGMDAYGGLDVTPAYVRREYDSSRPSSLQSVVDASNNLFTRGYWHTAEALLKTVPASERKLLPVGYWDGGAVSLYSFCGQKLDHLKSRFSKHLHRDEYRAIMVKSKTTMMTSDGTAGLIQFFNEEPDPAQYYSSGQARRSTLTKQSGWV